MLLTFQVVKHHIKRTLYIQQEILNQCGSLAVEIPSISTKKEVYRSHVPPFSYVSRKKGNSTAHP